MNIKLSMDKIQLFAYFIGISIIGSLVLSLPFMYISRESPAYIDCLFTAVSAVCVTGLSTVSMDIYTTTGFWVIMFLIEFGGLGIITFFSLYIAGSGRKISLVNRVVVQQFYIDDVETNPKKIIRSIVLFTVLIELIAAVIMAHQFDLSGSTRPFFDALFHSVSAFCNAGFSTYSSSLTGFQNYPVIVWTIIILIVTGGLGFMVLTDIWKKLVGIKRHLAVHSLLTIVVTGILIVIGLLALFVFEKTVQFSSLSFTKRFMVSFFQAVTPRTAGFSLMDQDLFSPFYQMITIILMFIGGSPGSIAGGIKTTTFAIVFLYAIKGSVGRNGLTVGKRSISPEIIEKAFNIMAKSLMFIITALLLLLLAESEKILSGQFTVFDVAFETVSAFATVGLSQGITGDLSFTGKIVIITTMFIGRIGIVAMAAGFFRNDKERFFEYPSASIAVG